MKNYLFLILLIFNLFIKAQVYTTGDVILSNTPDLEMQAKLDITETQATLTLSGPADRWFAIGFGGTTMVQVTDVFLYDGTENFDRKIVPYTTILIDTIQDWTMVSNTVIDLQRKIIATRDLDTNENLDYVFTHSDNTIPVIWSRSETASNELLYHGADNRGTTTFNFSVLGEENLNTLQFAMYPNPVSKTLNIVLPSNINTANIKIYNTLGKKILNNKLTETFNIINVSNLKKGVYFLKVTTNNNLYSIKQFVKK